MPRLIHIALTLLLCCAATLPGADQMPLRVQDQMPLFLKILSYDKNLPARGDEVVLGVFFQQKVRASLLAKDEVIDVMQGFEMLGERPVRIVPLPAETPTSLAQRMQDQGVNVLYVAPVRAFDLSPLSETTRALGIVTLTGVPAYVDAGLSVGLTVKASKPHILINLPASEAEGADFHSQLLRVAQVIR